MDEEAKQAVLAIWKRIVGQRKANAEFKLEEDLELGEVSIPEKTLVRVWAVMTKSTPKTPRKLGTFFLKTQQVSVMSDGRLEIRVISRQTQGPSDLPLAVPFSMPYGRNAPPL